ncbi:type II toxin-antitoxin system VapC family toxin [Crocosphaera sp. XPORK-15E]|uniref:type II toxin-antitoxin system VapC family toxin n=1 Tax=Crocosphaera sp. XPORK-15E TaxID=3110247 RepID=UPI002B1E9672|nr:PIN domain-containing protein [Crocosphaera sp. XPORK-15E]MEA5537077.1 PIN domain-containing protein [Crocosphaera sp. XPORK-15E]
MIIVDTGFWVALFNDKDQYHQNAQQTLAQYSYEPLITTWSVLTESCYLLLQRSPSTYQGVQKQIKLINIFQRHPQQFQLFHLQDTHLERIQELMKQYQSLPMDLADASLVILAEDLGTGRILSIDNRDFNTYRWKNNKPFVNLFQIN